MALTGMYKRKTLVEALVEAYKPLTKSQQRSKARAEAKGLIAAYPSRDSAGVFFHPEGTCHHPAYRRKEEEVAESHFPFHDAFNPPELEREPIVTPPPLWVDGGIDD